MAHRTVNCMLSLATRQTQSLFTMRTFAVNMGLTVAPLVPLKLEKSGYLIFKTAVFCILISSLINILRQNTKDRIDHKCGLDRHNNYGIEKNIDYRKNKIQNQHEPPQLVETVSAVHKISNALNKRNALTTIIIILHFSSLSVDFTVLYTQICDISRSDNEFSVTHR